MKKKAGLRSGHTVWSVVKTWCCAQEPTLTSPGLAGGPQAFVRPISIGSKKAKRTTPPSHGVARSALSSQDQARAFIYPLSSEVFRTYRQAKRHCEDFKAARVIGRSAAQGVGDTQEFAHLGLHHIGYRGDVMVQPAEYFKEEDFIAEEPPAWYRYATGEKVDPMIAQMVLRLTQAQAQTVRERLQITLRAESHDLTMVSSVLSHPARMGRGSSDNTYLWYPESLTQAT